MQCNAEGSKDWRQALPGRKVRQACTQIHILIDGRTLVGDPTNGDAITKHSTEIQSFTPPQVLNVHSAVHDLLLAARLRHSRKIIAIKPFGVMQRTILAMSWCS